MVGEVQKPGVYKLPKDSRIEDALITAGGISINADRDWVERTLNRAAKVSDGLKIYIPPVDNQSVGSSANNSLGYQSASSVFSVNTGSLININSGSQGELESLPGIGPVYAQSIIDHRPYSNIEELVTKGALKKNVYEKIKELVSVY